MRLQDLAALAWDYRQLVGAQTLGFLAAGDPRFLAQRLETENGENLFYSRFIV